MWPKTILPSAVAGPVAAKALQCSAWGRGFGLGVPAESASPSRPVGVASRAASSVSISGQTLRATMSIRSMGRPSKRAPAAAGPVGDALHLFEKLLVEAAQEQGVDERCACAARPSRGRLGALHGGEAAHVGGDLRSQQPAVLVAALVGLALDVQHDPAGLRIAIGRAVALHRIRVGLKVGRSSIPGSRRTGTEPTESQKKRKRRMTHRSSLVNGVRHAEGARSGEMCPLCRGTGVRANGKTRRVARWPQIGGAGRVIR